MSCTKPSETTEWVKESDVNDGFKITSSASFGPWDGKDNTFYYILSFIKLNAALMTA